MPVSEQELLRLTTDFVHNTARHIFLTGRAGTGKTTFLKQTKATCPKKLVVIAPTGVAAINAGGVTAHSFFQIPPGTFSPQPLSKGFRSDSAVIDRNSLLDQQKLNTEKRELIQSLELVIIDEVSMMRADMLDAIDTVLRHVRQNSAPFGGVQMLFIGDLYQLPPVTRQGEWDLVEHHYESPFFFAAHALREADMLVIELKHVHRQTDERFIHLLNRIRDNATDADDLETLRTLHHPGFQPKPEEHYITLTTHNYKADEINARELKRLPGTEIICQANVEGDFPDRNFPVESTLRLKPGAQIMFVRNDTEEGKYFNGKIGVVKSLDEDDEGGEALSVEFPETGEVIRVGKVVWHNIRYSLDEEEQKINEEVLGSFLQYPIRLAWAVTIHKSQGLTFQKAVIDAGSAFAPGQVYVALSRCVSMDGIRLLSRINGNVIMTDQSVVEYMRRQARADDLVGTLERDKRQYFITTALALFDIVPLISKLTALTAYMSERMLTGKEQLLSRLHALRESLEELETVAGKFRKRVSEAVPSAKASSIDGRSMDAAFSALSERMTKGKAWFAQELESRLTSPLTVMMNELKAQKKARKATRRLKAFMHYAENTVARFAGDPKNGPTPSQRSAHAVKSDPLPEEPARELYESLRKTRAQFARDNNVPPYFVCHDSTLKEMTRYLPLSLGDMERIKGMGEARLEKYGISFLGVIQKFCAGHGLTTKVDLMAAPDETVQPPREKEAGEGDSKTRSLKLFLEGKTVEEIAAIRNFATSTIEGHLAHFVGTGELDVRRVLPGEKLELIRKAIEELETPGLGAVKAKLGDAVTYTEIRFALNALRREGVPQE